MNPHVQLASRYYDKYEYLKTTVEKKVDSCEIVSTQLPIQNIAIIFNERSDSSSWEASVFADAMFNRIKTGEITPIAGIKYVLQINNKYAPFLTF